MNAMSLSIALFALCLSPLPTEALAAPTGALARAADETGAEAGPDGFWRLSLDAARAKAVEARLPLVVVATADWSAPSRRLASGALESQQVRALLARRAVAVRLDVPRAPEGQTAQWLNQHRVDELPAVVVLEAGTAELGRIRGHRDAEAFQRELGALLERARPSVAFTAARSKEQLARPAMRLELARLLVSEGALDEALEELVWLYTKGAAAEPSFAPLRNGPVLGLWASLARQHAPARAALAARADLAKAAVESGSATPAVAADFAALARAAGQNQSPLAVWDALGTPGHPGAALRPYLFEEVAVDLVRAGRDEEALSAAGDPLARVERRMEEQKRASLHPVPGTEALQLRARERVLEEGLLWFAPLLRTERRVEANALADRLLAFDPTDRTYAHLVRISANLGKSGTARDLVARGRANLAAEQRRELEAAAKAAGL